jgi:hypothetical protein
MNRVSLFIGQLCVFQQTLAIHPNNNRGTETQQSTSDFDANGNLLTLNNIGTLDWHYNNTLNQLTKANKINIIEYYVYDYQGNRARNSSANTLFILLTAPSSIFFCPAIVLTCPVKSLYLSDKAQTLSYEHYYPYGGTAIIASKDKTQAQQSWL